MFVRLIILVSFFFLILQVPEKFLKLDYFNLTKIDIENSSKMLDTELTNLSKKLYNKNNFDIDYKELEKFIKSDIRVKDVEIEKVGLGELKIKVEGKPFLYYALIKKNIYLVDEKGELFGYMLEEKKGSVPLIVANSREEVQELSSLLKKIQDRALYKLISQIYKKNEDDYRIVLIDGVELKINLEVDASRYKVLEALYSEMKKNKKIEYIDLRFDDYIIKYLGAE